MSQFVIGINNFVDDYSLQVPISPYNRTYKTFKLGLVWLRITFRNQNIPNRIFIGSNDVINSFQNISNQQLIGSFYNSIGSDNKQFFSEPPLQIYGDIDDISYINISLYDQNQKIISRERILHLNLCFTLLNPSTMNHLMLNLIGDIEHIGASSDGTEKYTCTFNLRKKVRFKDSDKVSLAEIYLPKLHRGRRIVKNNDLIVRNRNAIFGISLSSNIINEEYSLGSRYLNRFCVKSLQQHYTPKFLLCSKLNAGEYQYITIDINVDVAERDLKLLRYKGQIEITLAIQN